MENVFSPMVWNTINSPAAHQKVALGTLAQLDRQMNSIVRPLLQNARFEDGAGKQLMINLQSAMTSGDEKAVNAAHVQLGIMAAGVAMAGTAPAGPAPAGPVPTPDPVLASLDTTLKGIMSALVELKAEKPKAKAKGSK